MLKIKNASYLQNLALKDKRYINVCKKIVKHFSCNLNGF